jgi:hypothetical protein
VRFADRGSPQLADGSRHVAQELHIARRILPKATPALNAMDHLWRQVKERGLANRPTQAIAASAASACRYWRDMSRAERLRNAGGLAGKCWLPL